VHDGQGNPVLECMCGNVLCGRTDVRQPFFTAGGSFWTNGTTEFLASTTEKERQSPTRNQCNRAAYESVALIPLKSGRDTIGLMQLNDHRTGRFTPETIRFFEGLGTSIGISLSRSVAEKALRSSEEQLRQSQKMEAVGRLAGGIAHDFNNLLTVISGYTELAISRLGEGNDRLRQDLEEVRKSGERAAALTRQMLAFSRRQVLTPRILDLNAVVRDMDKMLRRIIGEDIQLTVVLARDLWPVKADSGQIEQVIMNLALNSRDAMPKGGRLIIETANVAIDEEHARAEPGLPIGSYAFLSVTDTGGGIRKEDHTRIFEPFFTTKERGKGTGLGLSVVYGIVKQSGGYIGFTSEGGKGTSFRIFLPRMLAQPDLTPSHARATRPAGGTEKVLLVEDETGVRGFFGSVLRDAGYRVVEACSGEEALAVLKERKDDIRLLLTDVVLPGIGGPELVRRASSTDETLKHLFMSAYPDVVSDKTFEPGAAFLQKPCAPDAILLKVREVLDAPQETKKAGDGE
jgi:two-component system, cell cycle sensor histidine kinase and response regulator CckA